MIMAMFLADLSLRVSHHRSQTGTTKSVNIIIVMMRDATISILSLLKSLILVFLVSAFSIRS